MKFQIEYLKYLLESDNVVEEKELLLEDDIQCVNCVLEFYNWLIKNENLKKNNNFKPSQIYNLLYSNFYEISQFCYLLWECITNTSNVFQPSQLTLRYLFHFFYLDTLLLSTSNKDEEKDDEEETKREYYSIEFLRNTKNVPGLLSFFSIKQLKFKNLITLPNNRNDFIFSYRNIVYICIIYILKIELSKLFYKET